MACILVICDALAFKPVLIFNHTFAASGLIFPLSFLLSYILTDVYGFALSGRIVVVQLICQLLFISIVNLFALLPSPETSTTSEHYFILYGTFFRVLIASSTAVPIAYYTNQAIVSILKVKWIGKLFLFRYFISASLGNFFLVSISYPINFAGILPFNEIVSMSANTWVFKMFCAFLLFPLAFYLSNLVKKIEKLDFYDYGISYSPFSIFHETTTGKNEYGKIH
jgi:uncharacterized integral membrane protein (TIGR00697 family)